MIESGALSCKCGGVVVFLIGWRQSNRYSGRGVVKSFGGCFCQSVGRSQTHIDSDGCFWRCCCKLGDLKFCTNKKVMIIRTLDEMEQHKKKFSSKWLSQSKVCPHPSYTHGRIDYITDSKWQWSFAQVWVMINATNEQTSLITRNNTFLVAKP